ncbi:restriction endonuclease subunit S [Shewanella frigidimarina]|uniref:restriction endonuclease subunit S n=1 Tax=Shewanella frigidimarina TaxID=56812 RepID=UPI003F9F865C
MTDLSTPTNDIQSGQTAESLITQNIDIWATAIEQKSSAGRGSSKKFSLYGIKKLRELILELAVRGKLVPQDANDEPASVLLERIAAEKTQLVKEGKLKKQKPLPEVSEDEKPFKLSQGWVLARLGNLVLLENGDRSKNYPNKSVLVDSGIPFVNAGHLINGLIAKEEMTFITDERFELLRAGKFVDGDILFCLRGSLGKSALVDGFDTGAIASSLVIVRTGEALLPRYLLMYFNSPLSFSNIKKYDNGTAQPNLSAADLSKFIVPSPPLEEQHRIVAKVDELMSLCDALEAQTEASISAHQTLVETLLKSLIADTSGKTAMDGGNVENAGAIFDLVAEHFDTLFTTEASIDTLKQTILQLAVMGKLVEQDPNDEPAAKLLERIAGEKAQLIKDGKIKKQKPLPAITDEEKPFELPQGWDWENLNSLITIMDAGWSPACPPEASPNNDVWGVLKTTAVQNMEYREYENKVLSESKEPRPQYEVKVGDILITRAGPKNRVGVSCLVQKTRPKLMISDKIIRFHLIEVGMSDRYISLCLNAGPTAEFLESAKSGMAESQMNISQDKLKAAPIPLAPIEEQHRIVAKVDELMALCDQLKARLSDAQTTQLHLTDAIVEQAI